MFHIFFFEQVALRSNQPASVRSNQLVRLRMQMMPIWEIYHAEARTGAWPLTLHAIGQPSADKYAMVNAQGRERRSSRSRGERKEGVGEK